LAVITSPENPDGRLSRLIGSGETGGGSSTPEIRIVGRRGVAKQADRIRGDRRRSLPSGSPDRRLADGAKQADRIRGDWRRSLHSGNPDRRSAGVAKQADRIRGDRRRSRHSGNPDRRSAGVAKQADRIRGDRRRSLHSGNPDRRSAGGLRGLPAAVISSEGPCGRRFSSFPVPDSGPCSGAKLCDVHWRQ
jgi:hypothetical protein